MVSIHWEGSGNGCRARVLGGVDLVDAVDHHAGESGLAGAWDATDGDHEAGVIGRGTELCCARISMLIVEIKGS